MDIKIEVGQDSERISRFINKVLPKYLLSEFYFRVDKRRILAIDKEFDIDSFNIIKLALENLTISKVNQLMYIISINKNLKINHISIESYINLITYGNRSVKGYPIIREIFKDTSENIEEIWEKWKNGYKILRFSPNRKDKGLDKRSKLNRVGTVWVLKTLSNEGWYG